MTDTREFADTDLSGARFRRVDLTGARFRMVDLSGAQLRDVSLAGASVEGSEIAGLLVDGVEVGPLVEAELTRRDPARALRRSPDPAGLRRCWALLEQSWAELGDRAAALPAGSVDVSVDGEWSYGDTLRHLVFATDAWLGAVRGEEHPFHPWGLPFSELEEFVPAASLGIDPHAAPTFAEVLGLRADRVARVRSFLADVTPEQLAQDCAGPPWEHEPLSVLRCVWVILNEECHHLRFARRDLDVVAAD